MKGELIEVKNVLLKLECVVCRKTLGFYHGEPFYFVLSSDKILCEDCIKNAEDARDCERLDKAGARWLRK